MTVRQFLNRRILPVVILMLACVVAAFAAVGFIPADSRSLGVWTLVPFAGFAACIVYLFYGVRCPTCRNQIVGLAYLPRGGYFRISAAVRFCPFCGLSLDTEVDQRGRPVATPAETWPAPLEP
jgi:hypothetical protein